MEKNMYSFKDTLNIYFGETDFSEDETKEIEEMIKEVEGTGFKEKCKEIASKKEKNIWQIGRLYISKAACLVTLICLVAAVSGFTLVRAYIKMLRVNDMGNHTEVEYISEDIINGDYPKVIEEYFDPVWIPEGYEICNTSQDEISYYIEYRNSQNEYIRYMQDVLWIRNYYGAEDTQREEVAFGKYSGELVIDGKDNHYFLMVTDGMYLYSIIASGIEKETMIKMFIGE